MEHGRRHHLYTHFTLVYLKKTKVGPALEFKTQLCGFEHCLAALPEFGLTDPAAGQ